VCGGRPKWRLVALIWPLTTAQLIDLGAAALWDPQDAYLPTLDIMGIKCIWSLLTLRLAVIILLGTVGSLQCFPDQLAKFKGRRKEELGREWLDQHREMWKGWRREKKGISIHPA